MKILNLNQFNEKIKANQISLSDLKDVDVDFYNYYPKIKDELELTIKERIENEGPECDLNDIDVSNITDMSYMFFNSKFNGDISKWNVSKVTNMRYMFDSSKFNGDISKWNVSKVTDMRHMFKDCPLENNPPAWYKN